jgi:hypothetical protein
MTKVKKKPSKSAKLAAKLLKDSKLLTDAKASNEQKIPVSDKPSNFPAKPNAPNKMRPEKKRG